MEKKLLKRLLLLVTLCVIFYILGRAVILFPISPHAGDGILQDISQRVGAFAVPGYSIRFPEFDLSERVEKEYAITNLPEITRKSNVFFSIRPPDNGTSVESKVKKASEAEILMELSDGSDAKILEMAGKLYEFKVYSKSTLDFLCLYQSNKSFFVPDIRQRYHIRIRYAPDPELLGYKGFLYIETGGGK